MNLITLIGDRISNFLSDKVTGNINRPLNQADY